MKSQNYHFVCVILPLALFPVIRFVDSQLTYNSKEYVLILQETFDIGPGMFQNVNPTEQKGFWSYNFALEAEQGIMTSSPTGFEEATPRMCTLDTFRLEDDIFLSAYAYFTSGNAEVKLIAVLADVNNNLISTKYTFEYLPEQRWLTTNTAISVLNPGNYKVCLEAPGTTDMHSVSISELIVYSRLSQENTTTVEQTTSTRVVSTITNTAPTSSSDQTRSTEEATTEDRVTTTRVPETTTEISNATLTTSSDQTRSTEEATTEDRVTTTRAPETTTEISNATLTTSSDQTRPTEEATTEDCVTTTRAPETTTEISNATLTTSPPPSVQCSLSLIQPNLWYWTTPEYPETYSTSICTEQFKGSGISRLEFQFNTGCSVPDFDPNCLNAYVSIRGVRKRCGTTLSGAISVFDSLATLDFKGDGTNAGKCAITVRGY